MAEGTEGAWQRGSYSRKLVVSALGGGVSFIITLALHMTDADKAFVIAIIGALVFSAQELYDLLQANLAVLDRIDIIGGELTTMPRSISKRVAELGFASRLGEEDPNVPTLIRELMRDRMLGFTEAMAQLRNGAPYRYSGEDRDMLLSLAKVVAKTVDAISMQRVDSVHFWNSELGNQYLARQKAAIDERKVKVRRIFIFTDLAVDTIDDAMADIIRRQMDAGIDVKVLLPGKLRTNALIAIPLVDFIVFDDTLAYETSAGQTSEGVQPLIEHVQLDWKGDTVKTLSDRYRLLWAEAERFPTIPRQPSPQATDLALDNVPPSPDPNRDRSAENGGTR